MEITLQSTTKTVALNGVPARIWEGTTASGIKVICFITRVAVLSSADLSEFNRELEACLPPSPDAWSFPARLVL